MLVKLTFKFFVLGILMGGLLFFNSGSGYSSVQSQATPPTVVVAQQADSPLLITSTHVDSSVSLSPRYGYIIINISNKPIRAFAVKQAIGLSLDTAIESFSFVNLPAVNLFLKPKESRWEEGGLGRTYKAPPSKIYLAIDFVEFADGARWGSDASNSGEMLDGLRAGGKAAVRKYREVLDREGVDGLIRALSNSDLIRPEDSSKSNVWINGFNMGVNIVNSRLKEPKVNKGQDAVKRELEKPFDSTEGRKEP